VSEPQRKSPPPRQTPAIKIAGLVSTDSPCSLSPPSGVVRCVFLPPLPSQACTIFPVSFDACGGASIWRSRLCAQPPFSQGLDIYAQRPPNPPSWNAGNLFPLDRQGRWMPWSSFVKTDLPFFDTLSAGLRRFEFTLFLNAAPHSGPSQFVEMSFIPFFPFLGI